MASGDLIDVLYPAHQIPTGTNDVLSDVFNAHTVAKFSSGTPNKIFTAESFLPSTYAGGGLTIETWWAMESATSGDIDVDIAIERNNTTFDLTADSFATAISVDNTTVPGTIKTLFKPTAHTFTNGAQMDSTVAGEIFRIRITRDSTNDTASGFAGLVRCVIKET